MENNRNRNQDRFRSRDRERQNRNQGNADYDIDRNRNRNQGSSYDDDNRFNQAGNFNNPYGGNMYGSAAGSAWTEGRKDYDSDDNDYNVQSRNQGRNRDYGDSNTGRGGSSRFGSSEYGRSYDTSGNRSNYGDSRNDRNMNQDRDWWDKTTDEVSSWFGDEEADRRRRMDKMNGPHRGKGPKGYTRSDDKIRDDVNDRLYHDSYVDASEIDVTVSDGEVTLTGSVDSKETKRRAEDIAEEITGVKNVSNNLKVNKTGSSWGNSQNEPSKSGSSSKDISESYRRN